MILLSLQGVQKSFGTNEVLRNASLVLQDGQWQVIPKRDLIDIVAGVTTK